jgi:hypothetical protein
MKNEEEIKNKLNELKSDERLYYPSADIQTNAPLALTQLSLEAQINSLEWVLGLTLSKFPLKK